MVCYRLPIEAEQKEGSNTANTANTANSERAHAKAEPKTFDAPVGHEWQDRAELKADCIKRHCVDLGCQVLFANAARGRCPASRN